MKKLQRFKWIPMIVRAYSDARLQQEIRTRQQEKTTASETIRTVTQDSAEKSRPSSTMRSVKQKPRRARPANVQKTSQGRNALSRPDRNSSQYSQQSYRSVLHELRETKKKLNRLESIHTQLTEMQKNLDEKLVNLFDRLETASGSSQQSDTNQVCPSTQVSQTNHSSQTHQASEVNPHQNHTRPHNS